jgi:hypothetical protein
VKNVGWKPVRELDACDKREMKNQYTPIHTTNNKDFEASIGF